MIAIRPLRLNLLRAMYLLVTVGLALSIWPQLIASSGQQADPNSVVTAFLSAFALLAILGIRYPLQMLPILLLELVWKSLWLAFFALPLYQRGEVTEYVAGTTFACGMGVILTILVVPWDYVYHQYIKAPGAVWH